MCVRSGVVGLHGHVSEGIDYQIGRTLASRLAALGLERIDGTAETAIYNGTNLWADYWTLTVKELREDLMSSGKLKQRIG